MPRRGRALVALGVVLLLSFASLLVLAAAPAAGGPPSARAAPHSVVRVDLGSTELAAARDSLQSGGGPAGALLSGCPRANPTMAPNPAWCLIRSFETGRPAAGPGGWTLLGYPSFFFGGGLAYDAADGYVLEFGGLLTGNSTWTYLHGVWTNISATVGPTPSDRLFPAMAYDPARSAVILFGGEARGLAAAAADTWSFHAGHWSNLTGTSGAAPSGRLEAGLAYDANDSALVLYGGATVNSTIENGTWEYVNGTWQNVTANQTSAPTPSVLPAFAGDLGDGYAVWYGGGSSVSPFGNQTWTFSGNHWKNVTSAAAVSGGVSLPDLAYAAMTTDSSPGGVMMYGGYEVPPANNSFVLNYRVAWHYSAGVWTPLGGGGPPGTIEGAFADDPPDTGMVYLGGLDEFNITIYADTWNLSGGIWHHADGPSSPTPGTAPMSAYDSTTRSVVVLDGGDRNDTWTYAAGTWTLQHPARAPPDRLGGTLVDDPAAGGVLLFGGEWLSHTIPAGHLRNDTWLWANGTWTNLTATAGGPSPRVVATAAYDSTLQRPVLFGGLAANAYENDTWEFTGGRWVNVTTSGPAPGPREGVALSDDAADHGVLAFGGTGPSCTSRPGSYCNDTWTFSNGSWTRQTPGASPPGQGFAGLANDPAFGGEVLIGGTGFVTNGPTGHIQAYNSTWLYSSGHWTNLSLTLGSRGPPPAAGPNLDYDAADGYAFLFDGGGGNNIGIGDWWSLAPAGTGSPLTVGRPMASVNPVAVNATTSLSVVVSGGSPPYEVSWNGLPAGCASANATTISCTPNAASVTVVTVTASDALGNSVTGAGLTLTVTSSGSGGGAVLADVSVAPTTSTLNPNDSVVLIAHPVNATGKAIVGATFVWSVVSGDAGSFNQTSGGSVRFTAGSTAGTSDLKVVASYGGKTATGFANVTVSVSSVPPTQGTTTSSSSFPYLDVGIAAAVVVVVAIAVVALITRRRGTPPAPPTSP